MSDLAEIFRYHVREAVAEERLELPTLPEIALKIRATAQSDSVSAMRLGEVIEQDPGLAARLIQTANSPMFRGTASIDSLQMAIGRLGLEYAINLTTGLAVAQMFRAKAASIDRKLRSVWAHACQVAAISGVIAKRFTDLRPDQATLAGLTHSIGVLPILTFAESHPELVRDGALLDTVIERAHGSLGTMILHAWGFPSHLVMVPAGYTTFDRATEQPDLVDVVMVANLQTLVDTQHPHAALDWSRIGAFTRLGFDPDPHSADLAEFREEAAATVALIGTP